MPSRFPSRVQRCPARARYIRKFTPVTTWQGEDLRFNDGFIGVYAWDTENLDWVNTGRGAGLFMGAQYKNFWRTFVEVAGRADWTDDREIGGGATLERAGSVGVDVGMNTDERSAVLLNLQSGPRFLTNGAFSFYTDANLRVRAMPQLEFELTPSFTYTRGEPRFWGQYGPLYLFGDLEAASLSATLSATYTFSPVLTFQAYAQAFAAFGRYDRWKGLATEAAKTSRYAYVSSYSLKLAVDEKKYEARIRADESKADILDITYVPTVIVGKYQINGAVTYGRVKAAVDKALKDTP